MCQDILWSGRDGSLPCEEGHKGFDLMSQVFGIRAAASLECFQCSWCPQRPEGGRKR